MKTQIRKEMLRRRDAHHSGGGHSHCIAIMDRFLRLPEFSDAKCILLYASKGSEVHTDGIMRSALSLGKRVVLPVTRKGERRLELFEALSSEELSPGAFGILEPPQLPGRKVEPEGIDLAVVPGVSFDRRGHRIGYGMGYYDSLLPRIGGKKVGLAYAIQLVPRVPEEPHDAPLDMIVTEEEIIECRNDAGKAQDMPAPAIAGGKSKESAGTPASEAGEDAAKPFRVAVLASGRGSDFQSIIDGVKRREVHAKIVGLLTDNPQAEAIGRAGENGIPTFVIGHKTREELDAGIKGKLDELAPDLVVLAGYMKIIKDEDLLCSYRGRMINIHPSLLPKYPGAHAQKDAFEAGEKVSGYTIHFVDESLDGGTIIWQEKVDISGCKTAEEAAAKILEREHEGLPMVVERFASGQMRGRS